MRKLLLVMLVALPLYAFVLSNISYAAMDPDIQITGNITSCTPTSVSGSLTITFSNIYTSDGGAYVLDGGATFINNWPSYTGGSSFTMGGTTPISIPNGTIGNYPVNFSYNPSTITGWNDRAHYSVLFNATARNNAYGKWYPRTYPNPSTGDPGTTIPFALTCDLNAPPECTDTTSACGLATPVGCGAGKKCVSNKCVDCAAVECTDTTGACNLPAPAGCGTGKKCIANVCGDCPPPPTPDECTPASGICNQTNGGGAGAVYCTTPNTSCMRIGTNTYNACEPCTGFPSPNAYNGPTVTIKQLIAIIYKIMVPVSIGFGLFFIILAGYTLKTSEGDPIRKKAGMEQLTAAIIGTMFVVLSLTILQIIIKSVLGG